MKKLFLLTLSLLLSVISYGQGVNIGVLVPDEDVDGISASVYKTIGNKIERMIHQCGGTSVNSGGLLMIPEIEFLEDNKIEGGMRKIYAVEVEIIVKCIQYSSRTTFGSVTWTVKGNGYSRSEAVKNAVNKLSVTDRKFNSCYEDIRKRVNSYYVSNKNALFAKAKSLVAQQQYEEAMAVLYEYPEGVDGYTTAQANITAAYKAYQNANCSKVLMEAKAKFATKDYNGAAALIAEIDATSSCASEAAALSTQIRKQINADERAERQMQLEQDKMQLEQSRINASVEKERIKAVSNIVSAYCNRKVTYNTLIVNRWW